MNNNHWKFIAKLLLFLPLLFLFVIAGCKADKTKTSASVHAVKDTKSVSTTSSIASTTFKPLNKAEYAQGKKLYYLLVPPSSNFFVS